MKTVLLLLLLAAALPAPAADIPSATFYVQLLHGSDSDTPPSPQAKLVGPKLARRLHAPFKWKNYWETRRETVTLKMGQTVRKRMSPKLEVEIAWLDSRDVSISIYKDGQRTRRRTQPLETDFFIAGGDSAASQCWFIIVRRDNPESAD